jgi:hypothetical protein
MECRVPALSTLWSGTGMVMGPSAVFCRITIWLPRLLASKKTMFFQNLTNPLAGKRPQFTQQPPPPE